MNQPQFEIYPRTRWERVKQEWGWYKPEQTPIGDYSWRFRTSTGHISVDSREKYGTRDSAQQAIQRFLTEVGANYEDTFVTPPIINVDENGDEV